jgi:UPF0716 family protein affecting phage T7 exclusion
VKARDWIECAIAGAIITLCIWGLIWIAGWLGLLGTLFLTFLAATGMWAMVRITDKGEGR